jgi:hypothetical protein
VTTLFSRSEFSADFLTVPSPAAGHRNAEDLVCRGVPPVAVHVLKQSFLL